MILEKQLFSTNYQRILRYLIENPSGEYVEKEIQAATDISKAGVNFALRDLVEDGLIDRRKKGRLSFYSVSLANPLVRQTKVLLTIININPLVEVLKGLSDKIILFGSAAVGTDIEESDIDLLVLTDQPKRAQKAVGKSPLAGKVQAVIKKPVEFLPLKTKDPVFYEEVSRGLVVWEKGNE